MAFFSTGAFGSASVDPPFKESTDSGLTLDINLLIIEISPRIPADPMHLTQYASFYSMCNDTTDTITELSSATTGSHSVSMTSPSEGATTEKLEEIRSTDGPKTTTVPVETSALLRTAQTSEIERTNSEDHTTSETITSTETSVQVSTSNPNQTTVQTVGRIGTNPTSLEIGMQGIF